MLLPVSVLSNCWLSSTAESESKIPLTSLPLGQAPCRHGGFMFHRDSTTSAQLMQSKTIWALYPPIETN